MQEETKHPDRGLRDQIPIRSVISRVLIQMADAENVREQMREITARLGDSILKVGENPFSSQENPRREDDPDRPESERS